MKFFMSYRTVLAIVFGIVSYSAAYAREDMYLCMSGVRNQQAGLYDQAIADLENCIKTGNLTQTNLARTYRALGMNYNSKKDNAKAIALYTQALALSPSDPWNDYVNRGNALSASGDLPKALADYDEALKLQPNLGAANFNRGIVYEKMGQIEKAKSEILLGYQKGYRSPQISERMSYYKLNTTSSAIVPEDKFESTISDVAQWGNQKFSCVEKENSLSQISANVRSELSRMGSGSTLTRDSIGKAFLTQFPCPFSPYRPELRLAMQKDIEGVWLLPEGSKNLRYPALSPTWQQEVKGVPFKCQEVGFYAGGEMRTTIIMGAQMRCPFNAAVDMDGARSNPRVASWQLIRDGRLSVSRTDVENYIEEWDIFIATSNFSAANIQVKKGDLVSYKRKEKGNDINVATLFWHLQRLP